MDTKFNLVPINIAIYGEKNCAERCILRPLYGKNCGMLSALSSFILKLFGWTITGRYPHEIKKLVVIVIPHTSNWDFPLGPLSRTAMKAKIKFVGKASLFRPPFGFIFRWFGGIPVDRSKNNNFVDAVVDLYQQRESLAVMLAPEGTRKKVEQLKTGFYYIAQKAGIPILLVKFDYGIKQIDYGEVFWPTGEIQKDMDYLKEYFRGVKGKKPDQGWP